MLYNKTIVDYCFSQQLLASPRSILVISVGYHIIFNDSIVNNCILWSLLNLQMNISFKFQVYLQISGLQYMQTTRDNKYIQHKLSYGG